MDRVGCVDIRALPLQLLLKGHPDWIDRPVVVVDHDTPQGVIQWANQTALAQRILPGMRYAAGLALCRELHGGAVSDIEVDEAVAALTQELWGFSPRIEPSPREPGVFWLDASGLRYLYSSLEGWAACIVEHLAGRGFRAVVAVGFSLFGSYAAAKAHGQGTVFRSREEEQAALRQVPVECLGFDPKLRETLGKLGIDTLGGFIDLPAAGIRKRFGAEAEAWHRLAQGTGWAPLNPCLLQEPVERTESLDYPEDNVERLVFRLSCLVTALLAEQAERHELLKTLELVLTLDNGETLREAISPATPTRDSHQLLSLVYLRMDALALPSSVVELYVKAVGVKTYEQQLDLFSEAPRRRMEAAHRALARIRAELGNNAVVCARLEAGHLPEAGYRWEVVTTLPSPHAAETPMRPLVRRVYRPAIPLPHHYDDDPDGWLIRGMAEGPVEEVTGPYIVSGGWWRREIARTYYYVRTRSNRWLWIYHDQKRQRWFLQGEVQ